MHQYACMTTFVLLCVCASSVQAAERIGLVLSGGGARGLAHIGVLRALHEQGIEVHAIAGTSMGAIIGGLYASGHSAEQIEVISREMDWQYAFSDRSPRAHSLYEYRQLDAVSPVEYRLRVGRDGVTLPRGVLQGQHLSLVLDELFAPVLDVQDFDQLHVPFRAVAADLVTGEPVVIDHGSLSTAIRASMSIPGLLEPVLFEEKLLVDGGISDNIPVDALADQRLDRLIIVDVGSPRAEREDIHSITNVVGQLSALLVRNNSDRQLAAVAPGDVVITPDLTNLKNSDFARVDEAMQAGYDAAVLALANTSLPLASARPTPSSAVMRENDTSENTEEQPTELPFDGVDTHPIIDFIEVSNNGPVSDRVVTAMIGQKVGAPLDPQAIRDDISHIYALDYFNQIRYELVRRNGKTGLRVVCSERDTSNTYVQLGLELADDFRGNATFGLSGTLRSAGLNRYGGTAVIHANLGTKPRLEARFFQPLDHRLHFFIEPLIGHQVDTIEIFLNNDVSEKPITNFIRAQYFGGLDVGSSLFRQRGEARFGWRHKEGVFEYSKGVPFNDEKFKDDYLFGRVGWDTYDDLAFPHHGVRGYVEHQFHRRRYSADADYDRARFSLGMAHTISRTSIVAEFAGDMSGDDAGLESLVPLGGFLSLSGLPPDSIWGSQKMIGRIVVTTPISASSALPKSLSFYAGASVEKGNVWFDQNDIDMSSAITAGSVFLGTKTPLGPGYLSVGFAEGGEASVNLNFGHVFR